jgi:SHS2 domain-containing protein
MAPAGDTAAFEILEHTADIGLRGQGGTLEELFQNAARGLAAILDRAEPDIGAQAHGLGVDLEAADLEGLLVSWLDEVLFLLQERDVCLVEVRVNNVETTRIRGEVTVARCAHPPDGTELKATTYHQLEIGGDEGARWATVFFDV